MTTATTAMMKPLSFEQWCCIASGGLGWVEPRNCVPAINTVVQKTVFAAPAKPSCQRVAAISDDIDGFNDKDDDEANRSNRSNRCHDNGGDSGDDNKDDKYDGMGDNHTEMSGNNKADDNETKDGNATGHKNDGEGDHDDYNNYDRKHNCNRDLDCDRCYNRTTDADGSDDPQNNVVHLHCHKTPTNPNLGNNPKVALSPASVKTRVPFGIRGTPVILRQDWYFPDPPAPPPGTKPAPSPWLSMVIGRNRGVRAIDNAPPNWIDGVGWVRTPKKRRIVKCS